MDKDLEMFPEFNDKKTIDVVAQSKKDLMRAQLKLKNLKQKRSDAEKSLAFANKNKYWDQASTLNAEMAQIAVKTRKAEEDICYLERSILSERWTPKAMAERQSNER